MNGYIRHASCRHFETPGVTIKGMGCPLVMICNAGMYTETYPVLMLKCRGNLPKQ